MVDYLGLNKVRRRFHRDRRLFTWSISATPRGGRRRQMLDRW
jgi:hypothetical protein